MERLVNDTVDSSQRHISLSKRSILTLDHIEHNNVSPFSRINIDLKASRNYERKLFFVFQRILCVSVPLFFNIFK